MQLQLPAELRDRVEAMGLDFLARFLEVAIERRPEWTEALAELGHVYSQQGRLVEGLRVDQELVRIFPENPSVHYNLACSFSLLDQKDAALDCLERAVELGYRDVEHMLADQDLSNIWAEERFTALLTRIGREAVADEE
jgi:tetratricopeptide (TPR) repeat protein